MRLGLRFGVRVWDRLSWAGALRSEGQGSGPHGASRLSARVGADAYRLHHGRRALEGASRAHLRHDGEQGLFVHHAGRVLGGAAPAEGEVTPQGADPAGRELLLAIRRQPVDDVLLQLRGRLGAAPRTAAGSSASKQQDAPMETYHRHGGWPSENFAARLRSRIENRVKFPPSPASLP